MWIHARMRSSSIGSGISPAGVAPAAVLAVGIPPAAAAASASPAIGAAQQAELW